MGQPQTSVTHITPEEYLAREREADYKSEYYAGEVFAMAGSSKEHSLINSNINRELSTQLLGEPCRVYTSDMRVKVEATGLHTYPDVSVTCGEERFDDDEFDTLLNPLLIVEVLSKNTESYDRGKKFEHYRQIESLMEYVLVSQDHRRIERFQRKSANEWIFSEVWRTGEAMELSSIDCSLAIDKAYHKVGIEG